MLCIYWYILFEVWNCLVIGRLVCGRVIVVMLVFCVYGCVVDVEGYVVRVVDVEYVVVC